MSSTSTDFELADRPGSEWFTDSDGIRSTSKHKDSKIAYTLDFSDKMASGETISSVSHDTSGPTIASSSNTTTACTYTITGVGSIKTTVTTSASRIIVKERRFYAETDGRSMNDYRFNT